MASNGNGLAVLKEIHKIQLTKINETYSEEYNEKKKKAETDIEGNSEAKKLGKRQGELEKEIREIEKRTERIQKVVYQRHDIPTDSWNYKQQLISKENARYEKELRSLLSQNDQKKDKSA